MRIAPVLRPVCLSRTTIHISRLQAGFHTPIKLLWWNSIPEISPKIKKSDFFSQLNILLNKNTPKTLTHRPLPAQPPSLLRTFFGACSTVVRPFFDSIESNNSRRTVEQGSMEVRRWVGEDSRRSRTRVSMRILRTGFAKTDSFFHCSSEVLWNNMRLAPAF